MNPARLWVEVKDLTNDPEKIREGANRVETEDGRIFVQTNTWFCTKCRCTCLDKTHAETCCTCNICGEPLGEEKTKYRRHSHEKCSEAIQKKRDEEEEAKKVLRDPAEVDWDKRVLSIGGDSVTLDPEEALEYFLDGCYPTPLKDLLDTEIPLMRPDPWLDVDSGYILERVDEEYFENARDHVCGLDELDEAFAAFNKINGENWGAWIECNEKVQIRAMAKWLGRTDWLEGKWNGETEADGNGKDSQGSEETQGDG